MPALFLLALASCSNDSIDVAEDVEKAKNSIADRAVSLEGKSLYGDYMKARFEGSHRAYVTMFNSRLSQDENLYTYSATPSTLTFQMQKICAPDGSGLLVTQEGYIGYWNSESFKQSYITEGISDYYITKISTVTASDGTVYTYTNKTSCSSSGIKLTTSGTSKASDGTESPLFTELAGYTAIESNYSSSEFTTIVTVTVYKETTTDGTTTTEADSAYALSLAGATLSEGSTVYSATDDATAEQLTDAQTVFEKISSLKPFVDDEFALFEKLRELSEQSEMSLKPTSSGNGKYLIEFSGDRNSYNDSKNTFVSSEGVPSESFIEKDIASFFAGTKLEYQILITPKKDSDGNAKMPSVQIAIKKGDKIVVWKFREWRLFARGKDDNGNVRNYLDSRHGLQNIIALVQETLGDDIAAALALDKDIQRIATPFVITV